MNPPIGVTRGTGGCRWKGVDTAPTPPEPDEPDEPQLRLSKRRVLAATLTVGALVAGGVAYAGSPAAARHASAASASSTWFAPYVDTTLTPALQFQDPSVSPARQVVLGFVVADKAQPCSPSWGGAYSLERAADGLNLDRRVAQLQNEGSAAVVSFGGAANTELAVACTDVDALTKAYASVVERYHVSTIDLDLEGSALDDEAATARRTKAVVALQQAAARRGKPLNVWLTLPVDTNGLQGNALSVVRAAVSGGLQVAGVDVMTMEFGAAPDGMAAASIRALQETHRQVTAIYRANGTRLSAEQVWRRLGATPMIGQNDAPTQLFTVDDAQQLTAFATQQGLGRLSMWSLNRDSPCGTQFARVGVHSLTCSGAKQTRLGFSEVFGALTGSLPATAVAAPVSGAPVVVDDPATAPFPIWNPQATYPTAYKVVREGYVYQAKWSSSAVDPAADAAEPGQTPWQVVGPVLPTDRPPVLPTSPPGTYPDWAADVAYRQGDRVLRDGLPYAAKYYSQGADPAAVLSDPAGSPWKALYTVPGEPAPAT